MEGLRAVVFDIGATLVEGPPVAPAKRIAALVGTQDHRAVSNIIMCHDFSGSDDLMERLEKELGVVFSREARKETEHLWRSQFNACEELGGSSQVLRFFAERNVKLALLSDIWRPYYEGVKRALPDIERLAPVRALSFLTGRKKPDTYNFRLVCRELGEDPGRILMVGDTYSHDIEPAIALGMKTCWLLRRPEKEGRDVIDVINRVKPAPDITIGALRELADDKLLNTI